MPNEYSIPDEIKKNDLITAKWLNGVRSTAIHGDGNAIAPLTKVDSSAGVQYGITPQHKLSWGIVKSDASGKLWGINGKDDYKHYPDEYLEVWPLDARGKVQTSDRTIKVYFFNPYRHNTDPDYGASDSVWRDAVQALHQIAISDKISYIPFATSDSADYGMIMWPEYKFGYNGDIDPSPYASDQMLSGSDLTVENPTASDNWVQGWMFMDQSDYNLVKPWFCMNMDRFSPPWSGSDLSDAFCSDPTYTPFSDFETSKTQLDTNYDLTGTGDKANNGSDFWVEGHMFQEGNKKWNPWFSINFDKIFCFDSSHTPTSDYYGNNTELDPESDITGNPSKDLWVEGHMYRDVDGEYNPWMCFRRSDILKNDTNVTSDNFSDFLSDYFPGFLSDYLCSDTAYAPPDHGYGGGIIDVDSDYEVSKDSITIGNSDWWMKGYMYKDENNKHNPWIIFEPVGANVSDFSYSGEHSEESDAGSYTPPGDGTKVTVITGVAYYESGDQKLYCYARDITFPKWVTVGEERRVVVDVPSDCS